MNITLVVILSLVFSAFFSGMEIAYLSANRLRIALDMKHGLFSARIINIFTQNPRQFISTMMVGNLISLVIFGLLMSRVLTPMLENLLPSQVYGLIIQIILSGLLLLLVTEFLPKIVMLFPNIMMRWFAVPALFFYIIFFPLTQIINFLSAVLLRFFNVALTNDYNPYVIDKVDLDNLKLLVQHNDNKQSNNNFEVKVFQNALNFSEIKIRECMVPRTEVVAIDYNSSIEEMEELFITTGFSKIPVYKDNIDNVIGYFSSKDLFKNPQSIRSKLISPVIVPDSMNASKLLRVLLQERKTLAVVVDEFGGTSGIVTIEDIIEEIFGEIEDEHDTESLVEKMISDENFIFSTRLDIEYLNNKYNLDLPESDKYETLSGFILCELGRFPVYNEKFSIRNFHFKVLKADNHKIELVMLKIEKS